MRDMKLYADTFPWGCDRAAGPFCVCTARLRPGAVATTVRLEAVGAAARLEAVGAFMAAWLEAMGAFAVVCPSPPARAASITWRGPGGKPGSSVSSVSAAWSLLYARAGSMMAWNGRARSCFTSSGDRGGREAARHAQHPA